MNFSDSTKFKIELIVKNSQNNSQKLLTKIVVGDEKTFILGRSLQTADIIINDPNASRKHIEIKIFHDQLCIEDLATKNGTFLNGEKVSTLSALNIGDKITIGEHSIVIDKIQKIKEEEITSILSYQKVEATTDFQIIRGIA